MSDKLELIMKNIHLLLANCEAYGGSKDKVIVSKRSLFDLLQELNYAVSEMMDEYEATTLSRELAERRAEEKRSKIIKEANESAEDVYAASMLYTDRMLIDLCSVIQKANHDLKKEYDSLASKIEDQVNLIHENQSEIREQLQNMTQSRKYIDIIEGYNEKIRKKREEALLEEEEFVEENVIPDFYFDEMEEEDDSLEEEENLYSSSKTENKKAEQLKKRKDLGDGIQLSKANKIDKVNKNNTVQGVKKQGQKVNYSNKKVKPPIKTIASVVDESALTPSPIFDDTPVHVSYEIKVNPWIGATEGGMRSEDLDAEYYQWKEEQGERKRAETEAEKKEKKFLFKRKNKE